MGRKAERTLWILVVICLAALLVVLVSSGEEKILWPSQAAEIPCDGISLTVSATRREAGLTVRNDGVMNYIVFEPKDIVLEKKVDGVWARLKWLGGKAGPTEALSPQDEIRTLNFKWNDTIRENLGKGEYRIVFPFWIMEKNEDDVLEQSETFVIIEEFTIN